MYAWWTLLCVHTQTETASSKGSKNRNPKCMVGTYLPAHKICNSRCVQTCLLRGFGVSAVFLGSRGQTKHISVPWVKGNMHEQRGKLVRFQKLKNLSLGPLETRLQVRGCWPVHVGCIITFFIQRMHATRAHAQLSVFLERKNCNWFRQDKRKHWGFFTTSK
jgi:hypothetical protein